MGLHWQRCHIAWGVERAGGRGERDFALKCCEVALVGEGCRVCWSLCACVFFYVNIFKPWLVPPLLLWSPSNVWGVSPRTRAFENRCCGHC